MTNHTNNLDCTDIKALLSALIDDQTDDQTRYAAERHLADCVACRTLISEAETLDAMVAAETTSLSSDKLPEGFAGAVLAQTVYDEPNRSSMAFPHWGTWFGWFAIAAVLALAVTIWVIDLQLGIGSTNVAKVNTDSKLTTPTNTTPTIYRTVAHSWVRDFNVEEDENSIAIINDESLDEVVTDTTTTDDVESMPAILAVPPTLLTRDDSETLDATSLLLDLLRDADADSFADVEWVRYAAEYDELLPRLAETRSRLSAAEIPAVMNAESILQSIVRGPISLDDVRDLRNVVSELDLNNRIRAISNGSDSISF